VTTAGTVASAPELCIEHVAVHFGGLVAIADLDFTVARGEVVGLIGANGAGKTTAFNVITGFQRPTRGRVLYRGTLVNGLDPHKVASLGLVRTFQRTSVFQAHTLWDNLLIGLHRQGRAGVWDTLLGLPRAKASEREICDRASEILTFVGLEKRSSDLAGMLPYGDQRLLGVALALAAKPSMLLLDEPVSGMNPSETARFMKLVDKIHRSGVTILLVEHDMPMVMGICHRVIVLNHGRVIAEGAPSVIQRNPEVIRAYLGQGARRA
jgi:branched-chain amino acid transport system ATP-binding protein